MLNDAINDEEYNEMYEEINWDDFFANQKHTAFVNEEINVKINYIEKPLKINRDNQDMQDIFNDFRQSINVLLLFLNLEIKRFRNSLNFKVNYKSNQ